MRIEPLINIIKQKKSECSIIEWIRSAQKDPISKVCFANLIREIKFENISKKRLIKILLELEDFLDDKLDSKIYPFNYLKQFSKNRYFDKRDNFPAGNKITISKTIKLSRFRKTKYIISFDLDDFATDEYINGDINNKEEVEKIEKKLLEYNEKNAFKIKLKGMLPIFWFTKRDEIIQLRNEYYPNNPSQILLHCGLTFFNCSVMEMIFHSSQLYDIKIPTIFDAQFNYIFSPHYTTDGWGRALHPMKFKKCCSEAIHENLKKSLTEIKVERLGFISGNDIDLDEAIMNSLFEELINELYMLFPETKSEIKHILKS